jgi:hypothetical protein
MPPPAKPPLRSKSALNEAAAILASARQGPPTPNTARLAFQRQVPAMSDRKDATPTKLPGPSFPLRSPPLDPSDGASRDAFAKLAQDESTDWSRMSRMQELMEYDSTENMVASTIVQQLARSPVAHDRHDTLSRDSFAAHIHEMGVGPSGMSNMGVDPSAMSFACGPVGAPPDSTSAPPQPIPNKPAAKMSLLDGVLKRTGEANALRQGDNRKPPALPSPAKPTTCSHADQPCTPQAAPGPTLGSFPPCDDESYSINTNLNQMFDYANTNSMGLSPLKSLTSPPSNIAGGGELRLPQSLHDLEAISALNILSNTPGPGPRSPAQDDANEGPSFFAQVVGEHASKKRKLKF